MNQTKVKWCSKLNWILSFTFSGKSISKTHLQGFFWRWFWKPDFWPICVSVQCFQWKITKRNESSICLQDIRLENILLYTLHCFKISPSKRWILKHWEYKHVLVIHTYFWASLITSIFFRLWWRWLHRCIWHWKCCQAFNSKWTHPWRNWVCLGKGRILKKFKVDFEMDTSWFEKDYHTLLFIGFERRWHWRWSEIVSQRVWPCYF